MLWVSEGLTVYYEDIVLVRAGLMTPAEYRERLAGAMTRFEGAPGHRYQSATESSLQTWAGSGMGGDRAVSISLDQWCSPADCDNIAKAISKVLEAYCTPDPAAAKWQ